MALALLARIMFNKIASKCVHGTINCLLHTYRDQLVNRATIIACICLIFLSLQWCPDVKLPQANRSLDLSALFDVDEKTNHYLIVPSLTGLNENIKKPKYSKFNLTG